MGLGDYLSSAWDKTKQFYSDPLGFLGDAAGGPNRADNEFRDINRGNFDVPQYGDLQHRQSSYLSEVNHRGVPQIGEYERAAQSGVAGQQQSLADLLMRRANGQDSVSALQLRQGVDQGTAQQMAMAAGARPMSSAMAQRVAAQNAGRLTAGLAGQTALARAQEAQMAAQGLGAVLGGMRGSDDQLAQFNASQANSRTQSQAEMAQRQNAIDDAARNGLLGQSIDLAGMQQGGGIAYEGQRGQRFAGLMGNPTQEEKGMGALRDLGGLFGGMG